MSILNDYLPVVIHKESIGENRAKELFIVKSKITNQEYGGKKAIFEDKPLDYQREDAKFCIEDGNLCFFGGCGFDTLSALVELFFEKYNENGKIPDAFTIKDSSREVSDIMAKYAPNVTDTYNFSVKAKAEGVPYLYWQNHTCRPDETVNILGINFENTTKVLLSVLGKDGKAKDGREIVPTLLSDNNIMFIIPSDVEFGIYEVRATNSFGISQPLFVNEPKIWWSIGDRGEYCLSGGSVRFFGVGLCFCKASAYLVNKLTNKKVNLTFKSGTEFDAEFILPKDTEAGEYVPYISNGLSEHFTTANDTVSVKEFEKVIKREVKVPIGTDLCTVMANAVKGDTVTLFAGDYYTSDSLSIPDGVTLCGAGAYKTKIALHGTLHVYNGVEIYDTNLDFCNCANGIFATVLGSGVRIKGCIISQNADFAKEYGRGPHTCLAVYDARDVVFEDDEFYSYSEGIMIERSAWVVMRHCTFKTDFSGVFTRGAQRIVIEDNVGTTVEIDGSTSICPQISMSASYFHYIANNTMVHTMRNDREAITYDNHGTVYFGRAKVNGTSMRLVHNAQIFVHKRNGNVTAPYVLNGIIDSLRTDKREWHGMTATVMTGRGICQMRNVVYMDMRYIVLEKPFDIAPEEDANFIIGSFDGRHIIVNNSITDAGSCVQTYPPNYESIVVGNKSIRGGSFPINSRVLELDSDMLNGLEPYRQKLDPNDSMLYAADPNIMTTLRDNVIVNGNKGYARENYAGINMQGMLAFRDKSNYDRTKVKMNADGYAETENPQGTNDNPEGYTVYSTFANTVKGNSLNTFASIFMTTCTDSTVIEHNVVKNTKNGIKIGRQRIDGRDVQICPRRYLIRKNRVYNVEVPLWDTRNKDEDLPYKPFNS